MSAMGRPPRDQSEGWRHVITRAVDGFDAFAPAEDKQLVLDVFDIACLRYGWTCTAFCVMTTHCHFVVFVPEDSLAAGMHLVNTNVAREVNDGRGRGGHALRARYTSRSILTDTHLLEACRYVDLNPVRARACSDPAQWRWSSFRALVGLDRPPRFLAIHEALGLFGRTLAAGRDAYARFVHDGMTVE